jgi:hypothetical protein
MPRKKQQIKEKKESIRLQIVKKLDEHPLCYLCFCKMDNLFYKVVLSNIKTYGFPFPYYEPCDFIKIPGTTELRFDQTFYPTSIY